MKLGAYIPAYNEQVNSNIVGQLLNDCAAATDAGHSFRFWSAHNCDLVHLRNAALDKALKLGLDYLLMQDADVFSDVPGGPLMRLLRTAEDTGATVTGSLVSLRTDPPRANVWPLHVGEVFEADKLGTGMVLINLNKVREWYGEYQGPCFARIYENDKGITPKIGLDIFFCYVVRQHGGLVVCDATIPTVHVNGCHRLPYDGEQVPDAADTAVGARAALKAL